ncbi:MAG TPA: FAD-dependent oxidoreductase [Bryobacteraceae bacterium]|jgi:sulfide:quinone oxidoreductase
MKARPNVVILGGGFAGLESAFYLKHKLHDNVNVTLISDRSYFLFKPNTIYIPFGEDPEKYRIYLEEPTRRKDIAFIQDQVVGVDADHRTIFLSSYELPYHYLVIATGADMRPEEIPGLREHAITLWTPEEMLRLRHSYARLVEKAREKETQRLLFLIPPNNRCSGPLYEIALMTDTWLRTQGVRDRIDITWRTYEDSYIEAFGPRLNTVVAGEFEERGIHGFKGCPVGRVERDAVFFQNGDKHEYDVLVSFPPYVPGQRYANFPVDHRGFILVDPESRRVKGQDGIFAVGDIADFPIKQAFLALLQADAAADHIRAAIKGKSPEVNFEPMSMCVMEELNKATFAQVPLRYTYDPAKQVTVAAEDVNHYRVGVSPLWRIGKKALGLYLPWRFGNGEPFHAGLAWEAMDLGLKVMSRTLAHAG